MKGKKIIVWGLGRSGEAAAQFCLKAGAEVLLVDRELHEKTQQDLKTTLAGASFCLQEELAPDTEIDEIILSPGIPREIPALAPFLNRKIPVLNEIELAHRRWRQESRGPIIAVTGSNGKTTTVHMIHELIKAYGEKVFLGGNVGIPFCEFFNQGLDARVAVLELSSFQLESLFEFKAEVRVILNLSFTHGERYKSLDQYGRAKLRLALNPQEKDAFILGGFESQALHDEREKLALNFDIFNIPEASVIDQQLRSQFELEKFRPVGGHNLSNLWVATKSCELLGLCDSKATQSFIENFNGPEHRLEPLVKTESQWILNDSKSTNWTSTLTALKACESAPRPLALILGGQKRGENDSIAPYLETISKFVDEILLVGESGALIFEELKSKTPKALSSRYFKNLSELVKEVSSDAKTLSLIFSPAFPSFDQYKNYEYRGVDFKALVDEHLRD